MQLRIRDRGCVKKLGLSENYYIIGEKSVVQKNPRKILGEGKDGQKEREKSIPIYRVKKKGKVERLSCEITDGGVKNKI